MFDDFGKLLAEGGKGILEFLGPAAFFIIYAIISVVNAKKKKSGKDGRREIDEATRRHVNERLKGKQPGDVRRPVRREEVSAKAPEQLRVPASGRNLPYAKRYQQKQTEKAQRRAEHQQQLEAKRILERSRRERKVIRKDPVLPAHRDTEGERDRSDVRVPVPQVKLPAVRGPTGRTVVRDAHSRPDRGRAVLAPRETKVAAEPVKETDVETAAASGNILTSLYEHDMLKRAIVYAEILGKPVGLREVI